MTNQERLNKNIVEFLEIFNFFINDDYKNVLIKELYNGQVIYIYNDCMDIVGQMNYTKNELCIYAMNQKFVLSAVSKKNSDGLLDFEYSINDINNSKNCLNGKYYIEKGKKVNGILITNMVDVYQNSNFVGKCAFATLRNYLYIYDVKSNIIVKYRNHEFKYRDKEKEINIVHDSGNVMYEVNYRFDSDRNIYGNKIISYPLLNTQHHKVEQEIDLLMNEFNNKYFESLKHMKEQVNNFSENLFENMAILSLKNFDRNQLDSMLKIDFSKYEGKAKVKK